MKMKKLRQVHKAELALMIMKLFTHILILITFFGLMALNNPQILIPSRTMAVTMLTFIALQTVMNTVYGGYAIGKRKSKPVISSLILSVVITDAISYLQLQIMNVNPNNNERFTLFSVDLLFLLSVLILQIGLIIILVRMGNRLYFSIIPPLNCCIIIEPDSDIEYIKQKILTYKLQYKIVSIMQSTSDKLEEMIAECQTIFICGVTGHRRSELILQCYRLKKNIMCLAELEDIIIYGAKQTILDDTAFFDIENSAMLLPQRIIKRVMDVILSLLGLIICLPLLMLSAAMIKLSDGGSVFFSQERLTNYGRHFYVIKLRTMTREASSRQKRYTPAKQGDLRITFIGAFLRRFRIDEIPQLINVLKGDMSLVGPRPEMIDNVEKYKSEVPAFVYRERMKAGLTGYAQIEGKYNTSPKDKLMLDLLYIENFSIWLDIKLILRTFTVFLRKDSTEAFSADIEADTMQRIQ